MNQLFYNIPGGVVHKIQREIRTTISEVIVRSKRNKQNSGIGFIAIFLLKARVSYLTISKRKNLSLPLKDETDQFVTCLVLPECLSVQIAFHPGVDKTWGRPWPTPCPRPWRRPWPTLWPTLWPTGGQIFKT